MVCKDGDSCPLIFYTILLLADKFIITVWFKQQTCLGSNHEIMIQYVSRNLYLIKFFVTIIWTQTSTLLLYNIIYNK